MATDRRSFLGMMGLLVPGWWALEKSRRQMDLPEEKSDESTATVSDDDEESSTSSKSFVTSSVGECPMMSYSCESVPSSSIRNP